MPSKVNPDGELWVPMTDPVREPTPPTNDGDGARGRKPKKKVAELASVIMVSSDVEDQGAQAMPPVRIKQERIDRFFASTYSKTKMPNNRNLPPSDEEEDMEDGDVTPTARKTQATKRGGGNSVSDADESEEERIIQNKQSAAGLSTVGVRGLEAQVSKAKGKKGGNVRNAGILDTEDEQEAAVSMPSKGKGKRKVPSVETDDDPDVPMSKKSKSNARRTRDVEAAKVLETEDEEEPPLLKVKGKPTKFRRTAKDSGIQTEENPMPGRGRDAEMKKVVGTADNEAPPVSTKAKGKAKQLQRAPKATATEAKPIAAPVRNAEKAKHVGTKDKDDARIPAMTKGKAKRVEKATGIQTEVKHVPARVRNTDRSKVIETEDEDVAPSKLKGKAKDTMGDTEEDAVEPPSKAKSKKVRAVEKAKVVYTEKTDGSGSKKVRPKPKQAVSVPNATIQEAEVVRDQVTPEGAILKKLLVPPPLKRHTRGTAVRKPLRTSSMDVQSQPESPCPSSPYLVASDGDDDENNDAGPDVIPTAKKRKRRGSPKSNAVVHSEADEGSEANENISSKKKKTTKTPQQAGRKPKVEKEGGVAAGKLQAKLDKLDVTESLRKDLEGRPSAQLKPLLEELKRTYLGLALVDITRGEEETEEGYVLSTRGANKREVTDLGVEQLYVGTHQGSALFNHLEAHAMQTGAPGSQLDLDSLTTDTKQSYVPLRVLYTHVLLMLMNGSHRRKMAMDKIITPAINERKAAKESLSKCAEGSEAERRFQDEIRHLTSKIEDARYWVVKVYDTELIEASPNAVELMATLSTNLLPVAVEEQDSNKLWMVADAVNSLPPGVAMDQIKARVAVQTELYIDPGRMKMRSVTKNPYMMKALAPLARLAHFRKPTGGGHFTSMDRLRPIALHTDVCFLAVCEASLARLEIFSSDILGRAMPVSEYLELSEQDRENYVEGLVDTFTDAEQPFVNVPFKIHEILDRAFAQTIGKEFVECYGATPGSVRHKKWQNLLLSYTAAALAALKPNKLTDSFALSLEKRLYYMLQTDIATFFDGVYHATPMPIFSREVLLGWTMFLGQPVPKASESWKAFDLLAGGIAGMTEFRGLKREPGGPSSFQCLVSTANHPDHAGVDITNQLTGLLITHFTKGWRTGYRLILDDTERYKTLPVKGHIEVLMELFNATQAEVEAYNKELLACLGPFMVRHDRPALRPVFDPDVIVAQHAGKLTPEFAGRLKRALVMLTLSTSEWFRYAPLTTSLKKQRERLVLDIHDLAVSEDMMRTLSDDVLFDEFRQMVLRLCDGYTRKRKTVMSCQWDDIPNVIRQAKDIPTEGPSASVWDRDPMQMFKCVDRRLSGLLQLPGVVGITNDGVKFFEEGVAAAVNVLRSNIFLAQAKMAAIIKDPDFDHMNLDIAWAEEELGRMGNFLLPTVPTSDADSFFDEFADSLREEPDEAELTDDDEDHGDDEDVPRLVNPRIVEDDVSDQGADAMDVDGMDSEFDSDGHDAYDNGKY